MMEFRNYSWDNSEVENRLSHIKKPLIWEIIWTLSYSNKFLEWKQALIIDEHWASSALAENYLKKAGAEAIILEHLSLSLVIDLMKNTEVDFVVLSPRFDYSSDEISVLPEYKDFLDYLKKFHKNIPIFAYTWWVTVPEIKTLKSLPFVDIMEKPTRDDAFLNIIKRNLRPDLIELENQPIHSLN